MTKHEWQQANGLTDQEMSFLERIIKETGGQIVSVKATPLLADGSIIPFNERK